MERVVEMIPLEVVEEEVETLASHRGRHHQLAAAPIAVPRRASPRGRRVASVNE